MEFYAVVEEGRDVWVGVQEQFHDLEGHWIGLIGLNAAPMGGDRRISKGFEARRVGYVKDQGHFRLHGTSEMLPQGGQREVGGRASALHSSVKPLLRGQALRGFPPGLRDNPGSQIQALGQCATGLSGRPSETALAAHIHLGSFSGRQVATQFNPPGCPSSSVFDEGMSLNTNYKPAIGTRFEYQIPVSTTAFW